MTLYSGEEMEERRWRVHFAPHPGMPAVWDVDGDGREEILLQEHFTLRILNGHDGRDALPVTFRGGYHTPMILRPPGHAEPLLLMAGGAITTALQSFDGTTLWCKSQKRRFALLGRRPGVGDLDGDGRWELCMCDSDCQVEILDLLTGETRCEWNLGAMPGDMAVADLDGDGREEVLFGTRDGRLMLVGMSGDQPFTKWEMKFDWPVANPIICDIVGDGSAQILVGTTDGMLHMVTR